MVYSIGWDASSPDGAITPAADIDEEIQNLKTSLGERLVEVIPEWADDGEEPKKLAIVVGTLAARPAAPDFAGERYFAEDTQTLYIGNTALEWVSTGGIVVEEGDPEAVSQSFSAFLTLSSSYNLPSDTSWHKLAGYTDEGHRGSFYSGTQPSRITVPTAGDYKFSCVFCLASGSDVSMDVGYGILGAPNPVITAFAHKAGEVEGGYPLEFIVHSFAVGNYVEFWVKQATGTSSAWVYSSGYTHITVHRLP